MAFGTYGARIYKIKNHWVEFLAVIGWFVYTFYLFVDGVKGYKHEKYFYTNQILGEGLAYARAAAKSLNFNMMLILLPVCRNSLEFFRRFLGHFQIPALHKITDEAIFFHKMVAWMILFWTMVHYYAHAWNIDRYQEAYIMPDPSVSGNTAGEEQIDRWHSAWAMSTLFNNNNRTANNYINPLRSPNELDSEPVFELYRLVAGWTGVIITGSLVVICASAVEHIRRSYFEAFWLLHHLFILFFGFTMMHGSGSHVREIGNTDVHTPSSVDCRNTVAKLAELLETDGFAGKASWAEAAEAAEAKNCPEPIFVGGGLHNWKWTIIPVMIYFFERVIGHSYQKHHPVEVVKIVRHPSNVVQIDMLKEAVFSSENNRRYVSGQVGQYVKLCVPSISNLEWHPFTLTSAPEGNLLSCFIRCEGDWTTALKKYLESCCNESPKVKPRIAVEGPYGACSQDIFAFREALCIGMGIGITPFASLIKSLLYRLTSSDTDTITNLTLNKITFVWSAKSTKELEWFIEIMRDFETQLIKRNKTAGEQFVADMQLYITGNFCDADLSHIILGAEEEKDNISGMVAKTRFGRPNWPKIFKDVAAHKDVEKKVGVFFCGTPVVLPDLEAACQEHTSGKVAFYFHKENF